MGFRNTVTSDSSSNGSAGKPIKGRVRPQPAKAIVEQELPWMQYVLLGTTTRIGAATGGGV